MTRAIHQDTLAVGRWIAPNAMTVVPHMQQVVNGDNEPAHRPVLRRRRRSNGSSFASVLGQSVRMEIENCHTSSDQLLLLATDFFQYCLFDFFLCLFFVPL